MTGHKLILIRDATQASHEAEALATAVLAHVPKLHQPDIVHLALEDLLADPSPLDSLVGVAWVLVQNADEGELFEVLSLLQDRHLPIMLSRRPEPEPFGATHREGVVVCPFDTEPATAAAVLQALRSQIPTLRGMMNEIRVLRKHQGGLCDQIGRIDEELRLAAQLQREFLPKSLVTVGDTSFRVMFRPAGYVSGDIYDVSRLDEDHVGFFIADAVGHGVPAALLTMFIKRSLQTKKIDASSPRGYRILKPAEALGRLNHDLVESQGTQVRFATACYGVLNCKTREVAVARAGHPLPILLRANGETERLEPEGGLLGVFPGEEYEQVVVRLHQGDRLLLYSDGFEMAFADEQPSAAAKSRRRVASEQYVQEFENLREGTLDEALARLQDRLDVQAGSLNQRDDLTLLCLDIARMPQQAAAA